MVSIINITNGTKNLPVGIKIIILIQYGYLEGDSLYTTRAIIWMITILNLIILRQLYLGRKVLAWFIDPNDIENNILSNSHALLE